jgi:DNA phosphorothioation-dependent restriction protein DptH
MSNAFTKLSQDKLNAAVAELLCPRIDAILGDRGPATACGSPISMTRSWSRSAQELRRTGPTATSSSSARHEQEGMPFRVTSTKLVELRNPDANGELRQPLLVFIPTSLRTSAEDSFGVATFEEADLHHIYEDLVEARCLIGFPPPWSAMSAICSQSLHEEEWLFADDVSRVRYLLTALENGIDGETLGASSV